MELILTKRERVRGYSERGQDIEKTLLGLWPVEGNVLYARSPSFTHLIEIHELVHFRRELVLGALTK